MRDTLRPTSRSNCAVSDATSSRRIVSIRARIVDLAWARRTGMTKSPITARAPAARMPVTSAKVVVASAVTAAPSPSAPTSANAVPATAIRTDSAIASDSRAWS